MYDTPMNSCMVQLQLPSSTTLIISRMVPMPIRNRYSRSPTRYLHSSVPNSSRITVSSHLKYRKANWLVRMMRSPGGSGGGGGAGAGGGGGGAGGGGGGARGRAVL